MSLLDTILGVGSSLLGGGSSSGSSGQSSGGAGMTNVNNNYAGMNPFLATAAGGVNADQLQNLSNDQVAAYNALMSGANGFGATTMSGPGGMSVGFGGGGSSSSPLGSSPFVNLGNVLNNAYGNYSNMAAGPVNGTQDMMRQLFGGNSSVGGQANQLGNIGFGQIGNPLNQQAFGAAGANIANAGNDFNSVYNNSYQNLLQQMQDPMQQAQSQLNDSLFQKGMLGSSGGALQTQAFAKGMGQAMLGAQNQAYGQAMNARNSDIANAGYLANIGFGGLNTGNSLLSNAFNTYNNTTGLGSNIANSIFNQNAAINQLGLQGTQGLNQLGLNNFGSALNYATQNAAAQRGSAGAAGQMAVNQNFAPFNQWSLAMPGLLSTLWNGNGAGGNGLSSLFGGNTGGIGGALGKLFSNGAGAGTGGITDLLGLGSNPASSSLAGLFGGGAPTGLELGAPGTGLDLMSGVPSLSFDSGVGAAAGSGLGLAAAGALPEGAAAAGEAAAANILAGGIPGAAPSIGGAAGSGFGTAALSVALPLALIGGGLMAMNNQKDSVLNPLTGGGKVYENDPFYNTLAQFNAPSFAMHQAGVVPISPEVASAYAAESGFGMPGIPGGNPAQSLTFSNSAQNAAYQAAQKMPQMSWDDLMKQYVATGHDPSKMLPDFYKQYLAALAPAQSAPGPMAV